MEESQATAPPQWSKWRWVSRTSVTSLILNPAEFIDLTKLSATVFFSRTFYSWYLLLPILYDLIFSFDLFPAKIIFTPQTYLWLDEFVDCPYYVDKKKILVTMEKMALQLMLFAGDITKYGLSRAMSKADEQKSQ